MAARGSLWQLSKTTVIRLVTTPELRRQMIPRLVFVYFTSILFFIYLFYVDRVLSFHVIIFFTPQICKENVFHHLKIMFTNSCTNNRGTYFVLKNHSLCIMSVTLA